MQKTIKRFVTRRQGVELANAEGIPLTKSRVDKDCMKGVGPKPDALFGPTELFHPDAFLKYARGLVQPIDQSEAAAALPTVGRHDAASETEIECLGRSAAAATAP